jgi:DNA (cytosine-5)-methyltransferase 1
MDWIALQPLAGGMALGAEQAVGNKPIKIYSQPDYEYNDSFLVNYWKDVKYEYLDYKKYNLDLVVAVPVCAGLSSLNCSKTRGSDAPQNDNMLFLTEYTLTVLQPKVFIFENAPGLFTNVGAGVVEKLRSTAVNNDYSLTLYKTNTYYHGIPQKRPRTFALFWKDSCCPEMEYENIPSNVVDYLDEIPPTAAYYDLVYDESVASSNYISYTKLKKLPLKDNVIKNLVKQQLLDDYLEYLTDEKEKRYIEHVKYKLSKYQGFWNKSPIIVTPKYINTLQGKNYNRFYLPWKSRNLTVREMIWLMGHPHDYMLGDNPRKNINVIGQNVPVATAKFITSQAVKFLNNELKITNKVFLKQENKVQEKRQTVDLNEIF